ncbi:MAG: hypothetical protein JNM82_16025 [Rhodocyclaceae bacterium]|nr:hypothetical protein [Rhodocyclaceae bacterium]
MPPKNDPQPRWLPDAEQHHRPADGCHRPGAIHGFDEDARIPFRPF